MRGHARNGVNFQKVGIEGGIGQKINADDTARASQGARDVFGLSADQRVKIATKSGRRKVFRIVAKVFGVVIIEFGFGDDLAHAKRLPVEHGHGQFVPMDVLFKQHAVVIGEAGRAHGFVALFGGFDEGNPHARTISRRFDYHGKRQKIAILPAIRRMLGQASTRFGHRNTKVFRHKDVGLRAHEDLRQMLVHAD